MKLHTLFIAIFVGSLTACSDRGGDPTVAGSRSSTTLSAYLLTSSAVRARGDDVTVDVNVMRGTSAPLIGSYLVDIILDTAGVQLLGATASDGMVAANTTRTGIRIAGATGDGFQSERLSSVTFKLRNPAVIESMRLQIVELNSTTYHDERSIVAVAPLVFGQARQRPAK